MTLTTTAREQVDALTAARNADGGWGYASGRASRLEPTCLALIGLAAAGRAVDASVLARWPQQGGLLIDPQSRTVNAADNALALLVGTQRMGEVAFAATLAPALASIKGIKLPPSPTTNRQDNAIQGWPWIADTFSWLEPTAWCVLALGRWTGMVANRSIAARVSDGQRLLLDRVCSGGGWNYGNSNVLGKELFPYVPTTAIALLALQRRRELDAVRKSVSHLLAHCLDERSGLSLSLSRIALGVLRAQVLRAGAVGPELEIQRIADLDTALADTWRTTQYLGNLAATALALCAAAGVQDGYAAFRL